MVNEMKELFETSMFAGVTISILTYVLGVELRKKFNSAIFNPLLLSIVATIFILIIADIDYKTYNEGTKYLSWLLTPSTVCLAIPLYEQLPLLKKNYKAVFLGILSGVITGMISIFVLAKIMNFSHREYVSLIPKSITTAIGMGVSEELGGYVTITVAVIVITGVLGNILGEVICSIFKIKDPIAKGLAYGTSAHAMGTAKAIEIGKVEGAMSGLAIAVTGIMTVVFAPLFAGFI